MPAPFASLPQAAAWYDAWLSEAALPLWADAGVDPVGGLFHEILSVEGRPVEAGNVTLGATATVSSSSSGVSR